MIWFNSRPAVATVGEYLKRGISNIYSKTLISQVTSCQAVKLSYLRSVVQNNIVKFTLSLIGVQMHEFGFPIAILCQTQISNIKLKD